MENCRNSMIRYLGLRQGTLIAYLMVSTVDINSKSILTHRLFYNGKNVAMEIPHIQAPNRKSLIIESQV